MGIIMNIFTILYEIERKDDISLVIIIFLLIGIYGVIFIKEENNLHYHGLILSIKNY